MSRFSKRPILIPPNVQVTFENSFLIFKGALGAIRLLVDNSVMVNISENSIIIKSKNIADNFNYPKLGTTCALIKNYFIGVTTGFVKKLDLVGVGYRAQVQQKKLILTLGFSHPVSVDQPEGITFETPSQTEILIKGMDKHIVGQTAAYIRSLRPPEPYKGKGVKLSDEVIVRKEVKKK
ncbi:MAG: 50S ribosomal protein L6 [Methylacidiphilales bacterium]|nr:50S ribosomal protein L6 [Candidatus Methylacidiphilales bacterium]